MCYFRIHGEYPMETKMLKICYTLLKMYMKAGQIVNVCMLTNTPFLARTLAVIFPCCILVVFS